MRQQCTGQCREYHASTMRGARGERWERYSLIHSYLIWGKLSLWGKNRRDRERGSKTLMLFDSLQSPWVMQAVYSRGSHAGWHSELTDTCFCILTS